MTFVHIEPGARDRATTTACCRPNHCGAFVSAPDGHDVPAVRHQPE